MAKSKAAADNRRQKYLLALLVVMAAFYGYRQLGGLFGGGGDGFLGGSRSADFASVLDTEVEPLQMALLDGQAAEYEVGRNPWDYGRPPAPPPRQPPPQVQQPVSRQPQPERTPVDPTTQPDYRQPPPPIDVEFLGSFGPEQRKIAVFMKDELVINALIGDVVNEKFRVHAIGLESVDLTFEGFPDTPPERLPLKE